MKLYEEGDVIYCFSNEETDELLTSGKNPYTGRPFSKHFLSALISHKKLEEAISHNNLALVEEMLDQGVKPCFADLMIAVRMRHYLIVKMILPLISENIDEALIIACRKGHHECVKILLEYGADPTSNSNEAIRVASMKGRDEVVKMLLSWRGGRVDPTAEENEALRMAASNGHAKTVDLLLKCKVDRTSMDNYALRMASMKGYDDVVKMLQSNQ